LNLQAASVQRFSFVLLVFRQGIVGKFINDIFEFCECQPPLFSASNSSGSHFTGAF